MTWPAPSRPWSGAWRWLLGVCLVGAAVWAVAGQRQVLERAGAALAGAPAGMVVALVGLPVANWLLTALVLGVLTGPYARVPVAVTARLVGVSWLLNYLPLKPGLAARAVYLKRVHGVGYRASAAILAQSVACAAVAAAAWAWSVAVAGLAFGGPALVGLGLPGAGVLGVWCATMACAVAALRGRWRRAALAVALRGADVLVHYARYLVAFELIGAPASPPVLLAATLVTQAAGVVPVPFGAREWAVGVVAWAMAGGAAGAGAGASVGAGSGGGGGGGGGVLAGMAWGLAADTVNRAAELAVALPVGLGCLWGWGGLRAENRSRGAGGASAGGVGGVAIVGGAGDDQQDRTGPRPLPADRQGADPP
ncbi:MAG: hypothetical protein C0513_02160 [Isosphaera sp.]|nr:hypothetical protein [Isosphaera sp.]